MSNKKIQVMKKVKTNPTLEVIDFIEANILLHKTVDTDFLLSLAKKYIKNKNSWMYDELPLDALIHRAKQRLSNKGITFFNHKINNWELK